MKAPTALIFATLLAASGSPAGAREADTAGAAIDRVKAKILPALVRIEVLMEDGKGGRMVKSRGFGSGAIITPQGHVLTNHHVAGRGTRFRCTLATREEIPAKLVGTDVLSDLCVIQLDLAARRDPEAPVPVAEFGDSSTLKVGDQVFALGSPAALSQSVTLGIVANTAMIAPKLMGGGFMLDGERVGELVRWIGHDAVIFGGNSGGPLVDSEGLIIGINEVGIGSLGGAIPGDLAQAVARELIESGSVTRGWIGLEIQPLLRAMKDRSGALVASVFPGSPADRAGVRPGDFIHSFGGEAIPDSRSPEDLPVFNALVLNSKPGTSVELAGERDGEPMRWAVDVIARSPTRGFEREYVRWGITARELTPMSAIEMKRPDDRGVQVHTLRAGGPAAQAKPPLRPNDIITAIGGEEIGSLADLEAFNASLPEEMDEPRATLVEFERGLAREKLVTLVKVGSEPRPQDPLTADRGWLGASFQVVGSDLAAALGLETKNGVRITRLATGGPAAEAGLREGDVITKLDGRVLPVKRPEDLRIFTESLAARQPGTEVTLEVARGSGTLTVVAGLLARPQDEDDAAEWEDPHFEFTARDLTQATRDAARLPADLQAVRVVKVVPNGWASLAGLRGGDLILSIDGHGIADATELERVLKTLKKERSERTVFFVQRGARHAFYEVEPSWPQR